MADSGNRLKDAITFYTEQDVKYNIGSIAGGKQDRTALLLKEDYYNNLLSTFKRRLTPDEKKTRAFLKNEMRKLKIKINPTIINRILHGNLTRWIRNLITGNSASIREHNRQLTSIKNEIGKELNVSKLSSELKKAGFTQNIDHALNKFVSQGLPRFHIRYFDVKHPNTDFVLHFSIIPGTAAYTFEKYDARSIPQNLAKRDGTNSTIDWVSFNLKSSIPLSASDAFQLLTGNGISKNPDENKWLVYDKVDRQIKTIIFDIKAALRKIPLAEMTKQEFKNLINSLQNGISKEVSLVINGNEEKYKLSASPQNQRIRIFDKSGTIKDLKNEQISRRKAEKLASDISNSEKMKSKATRITAKR